MRASGWTGASTSARPAVKAQPERFAAAVGDQGDALGAHGALGGDVFEEGAPVGPDDLDRSPQTRAHGTRDGGGGDCAKGAVLERLEARLQKLAQLRGTEAQVLRAIAADLREALDVLARSSPDADVETTPAMATANAPEREQLLDVNGLAGLLGVTAKTVRRWRDEGRLPPAIDFGGTLRWRRATVDAWLAECEEASR